MAVTLENLVQVQQFATCLAKKLRRGDILLLKGDLGAGKTTLAQYIIRTLAGNHVEVTSPTFTLLQTYPVQIAGEACEIWHYDLYRIEHPAELVELGMDEAFEQGISIIEWPERMGDALPPQSLTITLTMTGEGESRLAGFETNGDAGSRWRTLDATT